MSLRKVFSYFRAESWAVRVNKAQKTQLNLNQLKVVQKIADQKDIEVYAF